MIGNGDVEGAQLIKKIWRLYVKEKTSKVQLLYKQLLMINITVPNVCPKPHYMENTGIQVDKLTIKLITLDTRNEDAGRQLSKTPL